MSVAVVMTTPRTCSGLAYCGVMKPAAVAPASIETPDSSGLVNLAIPKSRSLTAPSLVTRMLPGLMSRWMTRF